MHHPLTKEKALLTNMADRIRELKSLLKDSGIPEIPGFVSTLHEAQSSYQRGLQSNLSKLKRAYRHRHIAYCQVRKATFIEADHSSRYNEKIVDRHRIRLLTAISDAYSDALNEKLAVIEELTPCICIFTNKHGIERKLRIRDFEKRPTGDWVWAANESGTVVNLLSEWEVRDNDSVWMTKDEYDKLPPELQLEEEVCAPEEEDEPFDWPSAEDVAKLFDPSLDEASRVRREEYLDEAAPIPKDVWANLVMGFTGPPEPEPCHIEPENFWPRTTSDRDCYKMVLEFCNDYINDRWYYEPDLIKVWDQLPTNDKVIKTPDNYEICGTEFHQYVGLQYLREWLITILK